MGQNEGLNYFKSLVRSVEKMADGKMMEDYGGSAIWITFRTWYHRFMPIFKVMGHHGPIFESMVTTRKTNDFLSTPKIICFPVFVLGGPWVPWVLSCTKEKPDTIIGMVVLLNSLTMVMELECEGAIGSGSSLHP